ncbi:MAG: CYTH domain-containing protein [Motiliproteus sp.]
MAQEIELKLSLPPSAQQQLLQHPLLQQLSIAKCEQRQLFNLYFDTPDQALNQHRVALRIRSQGERYIQTLKTKGNSGGGLHQRQEWEWDLPEPVLDLSLLPANSLPEAIDIGAIQPAFNTDFMRTAWQLQLRQDNRQAHIELVLDDGFAATGKTSHTGNDKNKMPTDPISEIELELISGDPQLIFFLAIELTKTIPLRISRISKAERGFRLQNSAAGQGPAVKTFASSAADPASELLAHLLEYCQSLIESFEFEDKPQYLIQLMQRLQELQALLSSSAIKVSSITTQQLSENYQQLQELLAPWILEQQYPCNFSDDNDRQRRLRQCRELLQGVPLAQCLLQLSYRVFLDTRQ